MLRILQEKLRDKRFKEPIDSVRLFLDEVENTRPTNFNILYKAKADANLLCNEFIDLMRSRYGEKSLYILTRKEEHVPENSFTYCHSFDGRQNESSSADDVLPKIKRPIWFIDPPVRLSVKKNKPLYDGQSLSVFERERIVSGWWNGEEIARDYFVAESRSGMFLWVYKELGGEKNWFFQGLFE